MFKKVFKFAKSLFGPSRMERVRAQMAAAMVRQTRERILAGGDPDRPLAPRVLDGKRALTGESFLRTITGYHTKDTFGVTSDHVNIRRILLGTTGKGGTEPPIRPKDKKALKFAGPAGVIFSRKSEFEARPIFRISPENTKELAEILAGTRTEPET